MASSRYINDADEDDYDRFRKMRRLMLDRPPDPLDRVSAFERLGDYRPGVEPHRMDSIERYQSITNSSDTTFNSTQPSLTHAIEQRQSKYYSPPTEPSFDSERESSFYKERELNFNEERDGRFDQDKDRLYSRRQEKPRYDEDDVPLPKELTMKFGRLTCSLCNVTLTTQNMAKLHYSGKNHEKRVMVFLNEWCEKTNQPMLDCWLEKLQNKRLKQLPVSVKSLYCEICKLTLTSMIVATQHYDGRAHNIRKRELEISKAQGFGKRRFQMDSTEDSSKKGRFICEICQIVTTSQEQLENHFGGIKHKKMQAKSQAKGVSEYQCMTSDWISLDFESYLEHKDTVQHQIKEKMETVMEDGIDGEEAVADDCFDENEDDFFCNLCNVDSTSRAEAEMHIKSVSHQNELKLRKKQIMLEQEVKIEKFLKTCVLCDMKFYSEILYSTHLQCRRHLKNEKKAQTNLVKPLKCDICTLNFTDKILLDKHFQSKRHLKSIEKCEKYGINVKLFDSIDKPSEEESKILSMKSENVSLCKNLASNKIEPSTHTKFEKFQ